MKTRQFQIFMLSLLFTLCTGCASTDKLLRPERTTFIPQTSQVQTFKVAGMDVKMVCLEWDGKTSTFSQETQCLYYSVDEQALFTQFGTDTAGDEALKLKRNALVSFLTNISDKNCSTFLGRSFANKSSFDTGKGVFQDVLTGSSAAAANAAPQTAAGLGLFNLLLGKSVDSINSTFYFEKTFQALAAAINTVRAEVREQGDWNKRDASYSTLTIYDALAGLRKYDDACSIRVGLSKLQETAQVAAKNEEVVALQSKIQKSADQLAQQQRAIDEHANEKAKLQARLKRYVDFQNRIQESDRVIRTLNSRLPGASANEVKRIKADIEIAAKQRDLEFKRLNDEDIAALSFMKTSSELAR
jgi:hypothetical protein